MDILNHKTTKEKWIENEIEYFLNLFLEYEYGYRPDSCNFDLSYFILEEKIENGMNIQKVGMKYKDQQMIFYLFIYARRKKRKIKNIYSNCSSTC